MSNTKTVRTNTAALAATAAAITVLRGELARIQQGWCSCQECQHHLAYNERVLTEGVTRLCRDGGGALPRLRQHLEGSYAPTPATAAAIWEVCELLK